jgi:hypothetical protein
MLNIFKNSFKKRGFMYSFYANPKAVESPSMPYLKVTKLASKAWAIDTMIQKCYIKKGY